MLTMLTDVFESRKTPPFLAGLELGQLPLWWQSFDISEADVSCDSSVAAPKWNGYSTLEDATGGKA